MDKITRRAFFTQLSLLFGSLVAAELLSCENDAAQGADNKISWSGFGEYNKRKFKLSSWTGDDFTQGHQLRDARVPKRGADSQQKVDFVIIGGGMAGLSAAHFLRNHDFVLLEQYVDLGGQSRGNSHQGIDFSYGAAYIGAPENEIGQLLADLSLKPVKFDTTSNTWHLKEKTFSGIVSPLASPSQSDVLYKDFQRFEEEARPIWKMISKTKGVELSSDLKRLDESLFSNCLTSYSPDFIAIMESVSRSYNCLGLDKLSAIAGYITMEDLYSSFYAFPGGNSVITTAISKTLLAGTRVRAQSFVWSVDVTESGVTVIYSDSEGHMHELLARHAIVTVPPMVAARMLKNLDNASKAAMLAFRYGSYLVANCFFSEPVYSGTFDNWYISPSSFTDILMAAVPYEKLGKYSKDMGQALTIYQPYVPGSEGRSVLLEGNREKFSSEILTQLAPISNKLESSLDSIVLSRWGHAMPVMNAGYFARMGRLNSFNCPTMSLAHSSTHGAPCAESAVEAARQAVNNALRIKKPKT